MGWGRQSRLGDEIYCTTISSSLKKHGATRNSMKSYFVWLLICEKLDMVYLVSYSPTQTRRAYFSWVWRKMAAKEKVILYLNWKYEQPFLTKRILFSTKNFDELFVTASRKSQVALDLTFLQSFSQSRHTACWLFVCLDSRRGIIKVSRHRVEQMQSPRFNWNRSNV